MGRAKRLRTKYLAKKLLHIRLSLDLSQNQLIQRLGLNGLIYQGNVSSYESGKRVPPLPILLEYARAAGVCLDVLVDDAVNLPTRLPNTPKHKGLQL
jgi:transcriptional regulator with XRE-family HTH domain